MSKPVGVSEKPIAASSNEKLTLTAAQLERIADPKMMAHRKKSENKRKTERQLTRNTHSSDASHSVPCVALFKPCINAAIHV